MVLYQKIKRSVHMRAMTGFIFQDDLPCKSFPTSKFKSLKHHIDPSITQTSSPSNTKPKKKEAFTPSWGLFLLLTSDFHDLIDGKSCSIIYFIIHRPTHKAKVNLFPYRNKVISSNKKNSPRANHSPCVPLTRRKSNSSLYKNRYQNLSSL